MDNKEGQDDILSALEEFEEKSTPTDPVPVLLEGYLRKVAHTGETLYEWDKLKALFLHKLNLTMIEFSSKCPSDHLLPSPNVENVKFEEMKNRILDTAAKFSGAPFTIQRLCELIVNPNKHYNRTDKFLRGLEKNLNVVSSVDPLGNKIVNEPKTMYNGMDANGMETGEMRTPEKVNSPFLPPPPPANSPITSLFSAITGSHINSPSPLLQSWPREGSGESLADMNSGGDAAAAGASGLSSCLSQPNWDPSFDEYLPPEKKLRLNPAEAEEEGEEAEKSSGDAGGPMPSMSEVFSLHRPSSSSSGSGSGSPHAGLTNPCQPQPSTATKSDCQFSASSSSSSSSSHNQDPGSPSSLNEPGPSESGSCQSQNLSSTSAGTAACSSGHSSSVYASPVEYQSDSPSIFSASSSSSLTQQQQQQPSTDQVMSSSDSVVSSNTIQKNDSDIYHSEGIECSESLGTEEGVSSQSDMSEEAELHADGITDTETGPSTSNECDTDIVHEHEQIEPQPIEDGSDRRDSQGFDVSPNPEEVSSPQSSEPDTSPNIESCHSPIPEPGVSSSSETIPPTETTETPSTAAGPLPDSGNTETNVTSDRPFADLAREAVTSPEESSDDISACMPSSSSPQDTNINIPPPVDCSGSESMISSGSATSSVTQSDEDVSDTNPPQTAKSVSGNEAVTVSGAEAETSEVMSSDDRKQSDHELMDTD